MLVTNAEAIEIKNNKVEAILNAMVANCESYTFVTLTSEKKDIQRGCENCTLCPDCGLVLVFCNCEEAGVTI